jgi:hypothetical protein
MKDIPMTEETKTKILNNTESKIIETTKIIDEVRRLLKTTEDITFFMSQKNIPINLDNMKSLLEYRMLMGLLILDLASAMRIYLNAKYRYEELFSARQIIVIINEGFKKIYNFINKNEKGVEITKHRKDSYWIKNIGAIIEKDLPHLQNEYDYLTLELENCLKLNFDVIREQRDLSIHYDKNPVKVYDMLLKLDIEETFKKMIPFLDILNKMFTFTDQLVYGYKEKTNAKKKEHEINIDTMILKLESIKNANDNASISEFQEFLRTLKKITIDKKS